MSTCHNRLNSHFYAIDAIRIADRVEIRLLQTKTMKTLSNLIGTLALVVFVSGANAQTVTVDIVRPLTNGLLTQDSLYVAATVASTYEIQSVQASIAGRVNSLVYTTAAYTNCPLGVCSAQPGWSNSISLAGLPRGTNLLTVTAIDVFGNSNAGMRTVVYDLPPTLTVVTPTVGTVARPEIQVSASATDDDSAGARLDVFRDGVGGALLATGTNSLTTTLSFSGEDGNMVVLMLRAMDTVGQTKQVYRVVFVQSSSNLVEIASASNGRIMDVQPDRLLFETFPNDTLPPEYWSSQTLKVKTLTNGVESQLFFKTNMNLFDARLAPVGAVLVASGSPFAGYSTGYALYQPQDGVEHLHGIHGLAVISLQTKGKYAAWGWGYAFGFYPQIYLTDLETTNTVAINNDLGTGDVNYDLAANGDIVFAPVNSYGSHAIYRFRNGTNQLLASISGNQNQSTNQLISPRTDGSNVFYIQITPTNHMLKKISAAGETTLATGLTLDAYYLVNNGWVAYRRNLSGTSQIWRCSPAGSNTQLTFSGAFSPLAGLSPEGEVAFHTGSQLNISKGTWPPVTVATDGATSGLQVWWQEGRWLATIGRSLFQIYTGTPLFLPPRLSENNIALGLVGPKGKHLVVECTTNMVNWTPIATNYITDGASFQTHDAVDPSAAARAYRLRLQ